MKKFSLILLFCFFSSLSFAIPLPEGTDARLKDITMEDDVITSVVLSEPTALNTPLGKVEATGRVEFYTNGIIKTLSVNKTDSLKTPIGTFKYTKYEEIDFYESGALKQITLAEPATITINKETYKINKGYFFLYDEWHPATFELVEEKKLTFDFGTVVLAKESFVMFYSDGSIASFNVNGPTEIKTSVGKITTQGHIILSPDSQIGFVDVYQTDGLDSKYGKLYPVSGTPIYFSLTGQISEFTSQDIMVCTIDGSTVMTKAGEVITFDDEGNISSGTLKNAKIKYKGWDITFYEENTKFIIYDGDKLYLPYAKAKEINGVSAKNVSTRYLFLEDCYYSWDLKPPYRDITQQIWITKKSDPFFTRAFKRTTEGAVSHYMEDSKEIDRYNCPLIFDENNEVIGYRNALTIERYFNEYTDRWEETSHLDYLKDEYVNYTKDVYFTQK